MTNILSLLGIDEKETEILGLKSELAKVLKKNTELSNTIGELIVQREALQEKLRRR